MKKTVVIVDDEKDILDLIKKILMEDDYQILLAREGRELFSILQKTKPDLVVLDVMMPEIDGFEICRRLKSKPETMAIPVLILTVLTDTRDVQKAQTMGASAYMTKPFDPDELANKIKTLITAAGN